MWQRVSRNNPCPICSRTHYCTVNPQLHLARCTRVQAITESKDRTGAIAWLHPLDGNSPEWIPPEKQNNATPKLTIREITDLAMQMFTHSDAPAQRQRTSERLGVPDWTLRALCVGIGWTTQGKEFSSWPSRNETGEIIGITRRFKNGKKLSIKGTSNAGLFIPSHNDKKYWIGARCVWLVEGGSDVAAAIAHGFPAIGRPNNSGGAIIAAKWLAKFPNIQKIIVFGENDYRSPCPVPNSIHGKNSHCPGCYPGLYGAKNVAQQLSNLTQSTVLLRMPRSGAKDLRDMLHDNCVSKLPHQQQRIYPSVIKTAVNA